MTALLSLLAVTTRSLLSVYLGVIGFFVLWAAAGYLARDISTTTSRRSLIRSERERSNDHAVLVGEREQHAAPGR